MGEEQREGRGGFDARIDRSLSLKDTRGDFLGKEVEEPCWLKEGGPYRKKIPGRRLVL